MSDPRFRRVARVVTWIGTLIALLIVPPVATRLFCLDELSTGDEFGMWTLATLLASAAWWLAPRRTWLAAMFLGVLSLIAAELAARVWVRNGNDWTRGRLVQLARRTYEDYAAYGGHPFLQYTGRTEVALIGNNALGSLRPFNRLGFHGPELAQPKPAATVRICCLGASTTASGYPGCMQAWLNERDPNTHFECGNFGLGFYTSNHSIINFVLNVIDLQPDYAVFHHGWNEQRSGGNAANFRTDYAHVLQPYQFPSAPDALLIRASVIYRFLKHKVDPSPSWTFLDAALVRPHDKSLGWDTTPVAATFRKNIRTFVDLAQARGIVPVLVTQPHSTAPDVPFAAAREGIQAFAAIMREVAMELGDRVLLVDLDAELSGHSDELFRDVGHMTTEGVTLKGARIGAAIDAHRRSR